MHLSRGIVGPLLVFVASLGCGQIEPIEPAKQAAPAGSVPAVPQDPAPPPPSASPAPPPPGTCGAIASERSFATADDQAVALHGLWIACAAALPPALCPASDASMFFGAREARADPGSRAVACGHVTPHGDGFVENVAYRFTYEVKNLAQAGAPPSYVLRVSNATTDRTFALSYRDDTAATGFLTDGTITLGEPDGHPGTLRHSAFTTY